MHFSQLCVYAKLNSILMKRDPCIFSTLLKTYIVEILYYAFVYVMSILLITGYISMEEFAEACDLLGKHLASPIPQQQKLEMARSMDMNKDGKIDLNEFMETFRIVSAEHEADDSLDYEELDD